MGKCFSVKRGTLVIYILKGTLYSFEKEHDYIFLKGEYSSFINYWAWLSATFFHCGLRNRILAITTTRYGSLDDRKGAQLVSDSGKYSQEGVLIKGQLHQK